MCIRCCMPKVNCQIKRHWQHGKWGAQSCGLPKAHMHIAVWTHSWWSVALCLSMCFSKEWLLNMEISAIRTAEGSLNLF